VAGALVAGTVGATGYGLYKMANWAGKALFGD
jgi:hypothetical protein